MATKEQIQLFIANIAPLIRNEAAKRGYKVTSPAIAQACIESAFGTSSLGYRYHNYFGMKCGSSWRGKSVNLKTKEEYTPGTLTTINDNFRVYDSMEEGVKGYFDFIGTKRYNNLKTAETPKQYLEMIKADGYATSSTYVKTNLNCIAKYNLERFDTVAPVQQSESGQQDESPDAAAGGEYYPVYKGTSPSIVNALTAVGEKDTSYRHRQAIAAANGYMNYCGKTMENLEMVKMMKEGKLKKA